MKNLTLLAAAAIIAVSGSASAQQNPPSLGERISSEWNSRADRNAWAEPYKAPSEVAPMAEEPMKAKKKGKKAKSAKVAPKTAEEKAKLKAERKAKWDAMTPEQKAAWKAKHAAKKAEAAKH